ncbi:MAG: hypothetical protein CV088_05105 [Nitrospira sp. LK70]|nr:hypothetical protein [Nitrospira sp. LK70]
MLSATPRTDIWFAVGESSLGSILMAKSERGICAIFLGDDPDALARELQDQFPRATLIGDDADVDQLVAKTVVSIPSTFPLDANTDNLPFPLQCSSLSPITGKLWQLHRCCLTWSSSGFVIRQYAYGELERGAGQSGPARSHRLISL